MAGLAVSSMDDCRERIVQANSGQHGEGETPRKAGNYTEKPPSSGKLSECLCYAGKQRKTRAMASKCFSSGPALLKKRDN